MIKNFNKNLKGIFFIILASIFFSLMAMFIKLSSTNLIVLEIIFIRSLLSFCLLILILKNKKIEFKTKVFNLHLLRSIIGLSAMFLMYYSISKLPLSNVAIVSFTKIFFIIPLAIFFLKEKINTISIILIIIGYSGVVIVIGFDNDTENIIYYSLTIFSAFLIAVVKIFIKKISHYDEALVMQFWFASFCLIFLTVPYCFFAKLPSLNDFILVFFATFTGLLAQFFTIKGLKNSEANVVMPFDFSRVIFGIILGVVFFSDEINITMIIGTTLLLISGYFLALYNSKV